MEAKLLWPVAGEVSFALRCGAIPWSLRDLAHFCFFKQDCISMSFFSNTPLLLFCLAVHYTADLLNSLFGSAKGLDGNVGLQFQGQAFLFSEMSTPDHDTLIQTRPMHIEEYTDDRSSRRS